MFVGEHWGMNAFSWKIPNGKYLAKLYFAETFPRITGPGQRVFSFSVQGREFKNFDIWKKAGGPRLAYVETVPVEVTDGQFLIVFTAQIENPVINAIEIVPQADEKADAAPTSTTIRIKAGRSTPFTDSSGQVWQPDQGFDGGRLGGMIQVRGGFGGFRRGPDGPGRGHALMKYDADDTGSITLAELPESLQVLFPWLDQDDSGEISMLESSSFEALLAEKLEEEELRDVLQFEEPPSPQVVQKFLGILESAERTMAANNAQIASVRRAEWYSYAFTVTAMLLGVISFGHLLSNPPPRHANWSESDPSPDATRPVVISLGLICVLSLIDLVWTTASSGNAHFEELNPLGSRLLLDGSSPLVFKVATLAVSVLLLFVLRRYRGAQMASWWMCMVCTLLTFRWLVLDSVILS